MIGASPKSTPVAIDTPSVKSSTSGSTATSLVRGRLVGYARTSACTPARASTQPKRAAGDRQQHAFGHELPEQPAAAGAKRRAHRELAVTCLGARQQQVREVRAGDQQHEADRGLQHPDRAAGAAEDLLLHGFIWRMWPPILSQRNEDVPSVAGVTPTRSPQFCDQRVQLRLRRLRGDAVLQPADQIEEVVAAVLTIRRDSARAAARSRCGCPSRRRRAA